MTEFTRAPEYIDGLRQFTAEFETPLRQLVRAATNKRPDALSFDYQWAFCYGPESIGDSSLGLFARVWYVRVDGTDVKVAKSNDTFDGWEAEATLFSFAGVAIDEVDLAFDQSARPVVSAERKTGVADAPEVWLYYFDPVDGFVFESFGAGRNPRVLLDAPHHTDSSDVLLFYMSDDADKLCWRDQGENYAIENETPIDDVEHKYLEDVVRNVDSRVTALMVVHDPILGTYERLNLESTLYPLLVEIEGMDVELSAPSGLLEDLIISIDPEGDPAPPADEFSEVEGIDTVISLEAGGALVLPIIDVDPDTTDARSEIEGLDPVISIQSGLLVLPIINVNPQGDAGTTYFSELEGLDPVISIESGTMPVIVINVDPDTTSARSELEGLDPVISIQSGSLVVP